MMVITYWRATVFSRCHSAEEIRGQTERNPVLRLAGASISLRGYNSSMKHDAQELLQKALGLPENERAELAGNLIASLDRKVDPDVDAAWQQEIARRAHEVRSGQVKTIPWEEVERKGRSLLGGK